MSINISILGTGRIAEFGYIPAIKQIDDVNLVSVLSRDADRAREFVNKHSIPNFYTDINELLNDEELDAVIICTPDAKHEEQVIKSCKAGKHILCEKPMSTDVNSCIRMIEEIKKNKIIFGMAYNNRFNAGLRYIKDTISNNSLGDVYYARAILSTQQNDPKGWRALGDQSNFWAMSATGTHMIDAFRWFFGEPTEVKATTISPKFKSINDELTSLVLNFEDNLICEITASAIIPKANRIEIYSNTDIIIGENVFGIKTDESIFHNGDRVMIKPISSFFGEVVDFTNAILKKQSPRSTFLDGLRNVEIMVKSRE
jgi:predicted dehydrogenase